MEERKRGERIEERGGERRKNIHSYEEKCNK